MICKMLNFLSAASDIAVQSELSLKEVPAKAIMPANNSGYWHAMRWDMKAPLECPMRNILLASMLTFDLTSSIRLLI